MTDDTDMLAPPVANGSLPPAEIAAEWVAYLNSGFASDADFAQLEAWLAQSPDHKAAFRKMADVWGGVALPAMQAELDGLEAENQADTLRGAEIHVLRPVRRWVTGAAIAASFVFAGLVGIWTLQPPAATEFHYTTSVGQSRTVQLADGSEVTLGGASTLSGRFTRKARNVTLDRGRAYFDVTHDDARPFEVAAHTARVRVVGTAFDVLHRPDDVLISVARGRVDVRAGEGVDGNPAVRLEKSMQVSASHAGEISEPVAFDTDALSWRDGQLAYVDARLIDVISEINRYRTRKITVSDPALHELRVSFSVPSGQTDALLSGLEATLPVQVIQSTTGYEIIPASNE